MALITTKLQAYKIAISHYADNFFSPSEIFLATKDGVLQMLEAQAGGDGSTDELDTFVEWIRYKSLALEFLHENADFLNVIDGSLTFVTPADGLPSTYISIHNNDKGNEEIINGILALRINEVDSTFHSGSIQLDDASNDASLTTAIGFLTDRNIKVLYTGGSWGPTKFNAVLTKGLIKAIKNNSNIDAYDTLDEMAALYTSWSRIVLVRKFYAAFDKIYNAGYTSLTTTQLMAISNDLAKFTMLTSENALKLLGAGGGTWADLNVLYNSQDKFAALTSEFSSMAIDNCGATFTMLSDIYDADTVKFNTLVSENSLELCSEEYSGFDFAGLSTAYGTTYSKAADDTFRALINPNILPLYEAGITYASASAAFTSPIGNQLGCVYLNTPLTDDIIFSENPDTVFIGLVNNINFGGIETLGNLCS